MNVNDAHSRYLYRSLHGTNHGIIGLPVKYEEAYAFFLADIKDTK